jgi:hypothetical protein
MTSPAARAAAIYAVLTAAHEVGDHWVQIDADATAKGHAGPDGARACLRHCLTYTATQAAALWAANRALNLGVRPGRAATALAISAATHYYADRHGGHWRDPEPRGLVKLAAVTGHAEWLQRDPQSGYALDQSWHKGWITIAAVIAGR